MFLPFHYGSSFGIIRRSREIYGPRRVTIDRDTCCLVRAILNSSPDKFFVVERLSYVRSLDGWRRNVVSGLSPFHRLSCVLLTSKRKMGTQDGKLYLTLILLTINFLNLQAHITDENGVKSTVFLSPMFVLEPGSVANKFYNNVEFPRGHIAIKDFNAEVVDEAGNSIPLHETYLHHWLMLRYYQKKGVGNTNHTGNLGYHRSDFIIARNTGICKSGLSQYFGLGSETRKTSTHVPDPYGIEVGNPMEIPAGYEEKWLLNVHAIDTRGAEDRLGCTECKCDLYNVTKDEYGRPLGSEYIGGLRCCYDETRCRVKEGFIGMKQNLYMRYTVKWIDWDNSIVPVKIYILDVTDTWTWTDQPTSLSTMHDCLVEYAVEHCAKGVTNDGCIDAKRVSLSIPAGGDVIYAVGHQHTGGTGITLYGEEGRIICSSIPTYGEGIEAGNEAGYIVGMSTCYPHPGTVKISGGERLILESNYSSTQRHTGVMGLFYLLIAEPLPKYNALLHAPAEKNHETTTIPNAVFGIVLFGIVVAAAAAIVAARVQRSPRREYVYQSLVA